MISREYKGKNNGFIKNPKIRTKAFNRVGWRQVNGFDVRFFCAFRVFADNVGRSLYRMMNDEEKNRGQGLGFRGQGKAEER
jgi:hypothetical protein